MKLHGLHNADRNKAPVALGQVNGQGLTSFLKATLQPLDSREPLCD
jgi:hypothetical protein